MGEQTLLPRYSLPPALEIPRVTLDQPKALIPSYRPLVVPPSDLRAPPGVEASGEAEKNTENKEPEIGDEKFYKLSIEEIMDKKSFGKERGELSR